MRVLIADDSPISRRLLGAALRKWNFAVVVASSGTQAWEELCREDAPRLAILDWMMPGLSGPEVCRRVRQKPDNNYTYILLVTSRSHKEDLIEAMEAGADDYLTKPFDQNELKVRLGAGTRIVELQDELLRAQDQLRELATRDSLTQIWNRRTIFEICDREISRSAREKKPLGIVLIDLDRFKRVNDTYGHLAGDAVLQETARRLKAAIRVYDAVGRYGGEEFMMVLPGCDLDAVERQAQRMRIEIECQPVTYEGTRLAVSGSFGATALPGGVQASSQQLISLADTALYQAKQRGRNCVVGLPWPR